MFPPLLKTKKYLFLKTWSVITPLFYKWVNIDTWMHVHLFKKLEEKQQNVNQQQTTTNQTMKLEGKQRENEENQSTTKTQQKINKTTTEATTKQQTNNAEVNNRNQEHQATTMNLVTNKVRKLTMENVKYKQQQPSFKTQQQQQTRKPTTDKMKKTNNRTK